MRGAGTRFHAAGEHPGFMFERLATSLTALSQRVDKITVSEFVDCRAVTAREMLVDLMGMGKRPDEITVDSAMFRAISSQYEQSLAATADVLGLQVDEIRTEDPDGDGATTTSRSPAARCPRVPLSDRFFRGRAYRDGAPVLVAEEYWTAADDIPDCDVALDGEFLVRVVVDGAPPLRVELTIGNDPVDLPGVAGVSSRWR